jgi:hypothetical protein
MEKKNDSGNNNGNNDEPRKYEGPKAKEAAVVALTIAFGVAVGVFVANELHELVERRRSAK